jgi:hypothetical protein
MFESWVETIGGVLDVAGVPGLLGNADELLRDADNEVPQWRAFLAAWWKAHRENPVGVSELYDLATQQELLPEVLAGKGSKAKDDERSRRTRLGRALGRKRDYCCGPYRVEGAGEDRSGCKLYRLKLLGGTDTAAGSAGEGPAVFRMPAEPSGEDPGDTCEWSG